MPRIEQKDIIKKSITYALAVIALTGLTLIIVISSQDFVSSIVSHNNQIITIAGIILVLSLFFQKQQASISLQNAELYNELSRKQEQIENDLNMAKVVQQGLMSINFPKVKGLDLYAQCHPADNIGGDFYNIKFQHEKVHFFVGDVTGHGISSALIMALSYSLLNELISEQLSPGQLVKNLDNQLRTYLKDSIQFLTLFYGEYDINSRELRYVNAGHTSGLIVNNKATKRLDVTGPIVGMFEKNKFQEKKIKILPKSSLYIFTDGFIESSFLDGKEFSENEFMEMLIKYSHFPIKKVASEIFQFSKKLEIKDDLTFLALRN